MYCSKCGKLNDSDAKFCTGCGAPLAAKAYSGTVENKPSGSSTAYEKPKQEYKKPAGDPDKSSTLGIIALIMAFLVPIVGLILGLVDYNAKDGYNKNIAKWAMIASGVIIVLRIILSIALSTFYSRLIMEFMRYIM